MTSLFLQIVCLNKQLNVNLFAKALENKMLNNDKSEIIHYAVQYKNGIVRLYIIHMILWDYTLYIWYCKIIHCKYDTVRLYSIHCTRVFVRSYIIHMILWDYTIYMVNMVLWDNTEYIKNLLLWDYTLYSYNWYCEIIQLYRTYDIVRLYIIHIGVLWDLPLSRAPLSQSHWPSCPTA